MDKLKLILAGLLTTVYKMSDGEVADLLEKADGDDFDADGTLADLLSKDKDRVNKLTKDRFDQGHKKDKSEGLEDLEKTVREEYGITDDSIKGKDLIKAVHALDREPNKNGITDDDVKKHSAYIALQKQINDLNKEVETKVSTAVAEAKTGFTRELNLTKVKAEALKEFLGLNPVLSADEKRKAKQQELYLKEIEAYEYDLADDGSFIVKKDGKALDDGHGNLIDFKTLVKNTASEMFDFQQSEDRKTPGNKTPPVPGAIKLPTNEDDYIKTIRDESIPLEERNQIKEAWNNKQQAQV